MAVSLLEELVKQIDDKMLSKTRKSMNSKNIKKRPGVAEPVAENYYDSDFNDHFKQPPVVFKKSHREAYFLDQENEEEQKQKPDNKSNDDLDDDFDFDKDDSDKDQDNDSDDDSEDQQDAPLENKDPNRQGVIRVVPGAHLVYKRQQDESSYEELWIFNVGNKLEDELKIKRAILAGTDIEQNKVRSQDGSQSYTLVTMGNAQMLHISGLPQ
jgi:hypothetical protein